MRRRRRRVINRNVVVAVVKNNRWWWWRRKCRCSEVDVGSMSGVDVVEENEKKKINCGGAGGMGK